MQGGALLSCADHAHVAEQERPAVAALESLWQIATREHRQSGVNGQVRRSPALPTPAPNLADNVVVVSRVRLAGAAHVQSWT
jgi:hypothetical protein